MAPRRTLKSREVKSLVQGHTARKWRPGRYPSLGHTALPGWAAQDKDLGWVLTMYTVGIYYTSPG